MARNMDGNEHVDKNINIKIIFEYMCFQINLNTPLNYTFT